ncbi:MAG: hypothetical protein HYU31_19300 [Deltaproteobacteria bacterium]|nr:hypothetical protein [Deltaproteobacteria bacterium]MBI2182951.1 hypothetical protein [Deltaproteobacteria bacterium]MBI2230120.1 hypothetical protein [Deltaproteobacteria bacterium]
MEKSTYEVAALSGLAASVSVVLAAATPWGLGLSPDSVVYIGAARSLAQGLGFSLPTDSAAMAPVVHYPPLYPALLAMASFSGLNVIAAAKWLNVFLLCANVFLAGIIGYRASGLFPLAILTAGLVATAFPMALVHSMVWSEPLFMVCQSAALLFLLSYFRERACRSLIAAAVATALSILGRYVGVSLVISGAAAILWLGAERWKKKFLDVGIFLAVSSLPIGLWAARNRWVAGTSTNRKIGFHPAGLGELSAAVDAIGAWLSAFWNSPTNIQLVSVCVVVVGGLALGVSRRRLETNDAPANVPGIKMVSFLMALVAVTYLALLFLTISLFDAQTPVDSRLLAPGYVPSLLFVVSAWTLSAQRGPEHGRFRFVAPAIGLLVIGLQLPATLTWLQQHYRQGIGYSSREWQESETIKQLATRMPAAVIYSNAPDVIYALLGRPARMIPRRTMTASNLPNPNFHAELEQMNRTLQAANGVIVFFDRVNWRKYLPSATELESSLRLRLVTKTNDGAVYQAR